MQIMKSKRFKSYFYTTAVISIAAAFWFIVQPQRQLINEPLHSAMEAVEALSVFLLALFLLGRREEGDKLVPPALGFLGMGIINSFHAASWPGDQFVFLRAVASLAGGLGFSLAWLPASYRAALRRTQALRAVAAGSLALCISVFLFPTVLPLMVRQGAFTGIAVTINLLGGAFFIIGAWRFVSGLHHSDEPEDLLFSLIGIFFGLAGLTFQYSMLWSEAWWFWHVLRLLASLLVLVVLGHRHLQTVTTLRASLFERKQVEQSLIESEARLQRSYGLTKTIIDSMSEAISLIDVRDFRIAGVNSTFLEEYGYAEESEIVGKHCYEITHHRSDMCAPPDDICPLAETVKTGGHCSVEHVHYGKNGEKIFVEISTSPIKDDSGRVVQVVHVQRNITERKVMEEKIKHQAYHDELTGLPNRRFFMDLVPAELARTRRNQGKLAILFLDLDRFKDINDTLGHEAGDELLRAVSARLRTCIRESDIVARIGGDEFNIFLAGITRTEDITTIVRKIMGSFQKPYRIAGHDLPVTTSIGISVYPDDSEEIDTLFRYADIAMYHAKALGKNTYQFYNPGINIRSVERMRMEGYLRQTVERRELFVHYQPQIDIRTGDIVCAEALVRWRHPELGVLPSKQFIPAAEETGFITVIDEWVLRTACAQVRAWLDAGLPPVCVTVNLSAREFQNPELVGTIARILRETGVPSRYLVIEITETLAMSNIERTVSHLNELMKIGVHTSIDDFGTGYSSLNYLKRLPIQKLKIDQSFIRDIAADPDDKAIISAVTAMAHQLKIRVIAEGVETEEQLSFLHSIGCDEIQGYLFSKPLPAEEFMELIAAGKAGHASNMRHPAV